MQIDRFCKVLSACRFMDLGSPPKEKRTRSTGSRERSTHSPVPSIDLKHGEGAAGARGSVNLLHIGIFAEQVRQSVRSDLFHFSLYRNCHAGKGLFSLHSREGDLFLGFQPAIKVLALCCQEIEAAFIIVHNVDGAGNGPSLTVHGSKHGRVDLVSDKSKDFLNIHLASSPSKQEQPCKPEAHRAVPMLQAILLRRVAGEVRNHRMRILQIEHFKNRIGGLCVLSLYDGILDAHLLGSHVVFKYSFAA